MHNPNMASSLLPWHNHLSIFAPHFLSGCFVLYFQEGTQYERMSRSRTLALFTVPEFLLRVDIKIRFVLIQTEMGLNLPS